MDALGRLLTVCFARRAGLLMVASPMHARATAVALLCARRAVHGSSMVRPRGDMDALGQTILEFGPECTTSWTGSTMSSTGTTSPQRQVALGTVAWGPA